MKHRTLFSHAALLLFAQTIAGQVCAAPSDGSIGGLVTDSLGKPVADANVVLQTATGASAGTTKTDASGHFSVQDVAPGTYAIVVTATGFASGSTVATASPETASSVTVALTTSDAIDVRVSAQRLDQARNGLSPETGSSVYRITDADIRNMPQGEATPLNQVLLQAPGVAQDSYGMVHVRGEHANLQYRINGIMIPEPISGFGQSFDTRIIDQVDLLTGALPAQYGLRTAGIVDIKTKSGEAGNGGSIDMYGGSHGTAQTSGNVYGTEGALTYFFSGSAGVNDLGIEAPTSNGSPLHDHTRQGNAFGYMSYLINPLTRVSVVFGTASNQFQIPNTPGQPTNFMLNGQTSFNSAALNETQSELNNFATVALQGTNGDKLDYQVAYFTRYTRTQFNPDPIGDLLFNGVASQDFRSNWANGLQGDTTYRLNSSHTLRAGVYFEQDRAVANDSVSVFPTVDGAQSSDQPFTINSASTTIGRLFGVYVQDEWKVNDKLIINYGLRYDKMNEVVDASQLSPRVGVVYKATPSTTLHAGYARYFTPPPLELIAPTTVAQFNNTTNQAASPENMPVQPERSHYFDVGVTQRVSSAVTVGVDAYYKKATDLLDEGQFGTALINTPFNYRTGHDYGVEFTANYKDEHFSAYANLALSRATGENIVSGQFNFSPDELAYIASHPVNLDHDQLITGSAGIAYTFARTTYSADTTFGSGLRSGFANTDHVPFYVNINLAVIHHFQAPLIGNFDGRLVVVNLLNRAYELRDGSGIGVGAPQFAPTRAFYAGVTKYF
ncbi:TonB-dependent receptor [Paraburkholderia elongata]|uniref:TonB-dependent receptor plug domain-containing protein n=1 Tax=Paraburkholderia elongata TaxID=2675747 RepID=A0A972NW70_9BURK|nr:TonB-dependent receptor [Paraburkholderia elongata]NPT59739.1 TonB-dependent receptor plug domain-containing protein [Paraburkholderia elongata]